MSHIKLSDHQVDPAALIRNEPVQARSTARLAALLDAAAEVIDEIGYERLTTAMVADRAGASIGTVYRYFPDRIAVLQSLAARNAERMNERVMAAVRDEQHDDWFAALSAGVAVLVDAQDRSQPGAEVLGVVVGVIPEAAVAEPDQESPFWIDDEVAAVVVRVGLLQGQERPPCFQVGLHAVEGDCDHVARGVLICVTEVELVS